MIELSSNTRALINDAKRIATTNSHTVVSLEHISIILMRDQNFINMLDNLNIDIDSLKTKILTEFNSNNFKSSKLFTISSELNQVITESYSEAKRFNTNIIEIEHIFLSLLRLDSEVKNIFNDHGIFYEEMFNFISATRENITNKDNGMFANDDEGGTLFDSNNPNKRQDKNVKSKTPLLDNFSRDLSKMAEEGKLDPVIGRDKEVARMAQILSRRTKRNPLLVGEPGCVLGDTMIKIKKISDLNIHTIIKK